MTEPTPTTNAAYVTSGDWQREFAEALMRAAERDPELKDMTLATGSGSKSDRNLWRLRMTEPTPTTTAAYTA